jgi:hypothetical protein
MAMIAPANNKPIKKTADANIFVAVPIMGNAPLANAMAVADAAHFSPAAKSIAVRAMFAATPRANTLPELAAANAMPLRARRPPWSPGFVPLRFACDLRGNKE